ncbi:uncharacterized protein MELLADRAFT_79647 [Melampsora larici-populina 98AG31]|uniref:BHLH domain-containing protein n=1 Tax=Melampsora larici-populina (strain 98AG31 / pathotype 3-4-7) TaxID=747676 RepID=F4S9M4_MELLP|nr:uncharacterized protein MELLADRAFT_79647 [Melampsora larici-populina 98AG31]EGF98663.1 hypothetical protein MELLADRAFT_79647 [Melampsora larici-populina 98AG31]
MSHQTRTSTSTSTQSQSPSSTSLDYSQPQLDFILNNLTSHSHSQYDHHHQNIIISNQQQQQQQQLNSNLFLQDLNHHILPHHSFPTSDHNQSTSTQQQQQQQNPSKQLQSLIPQYLQSDDYLRTHFQSNHHSSQNNPIINSSIPSQSNLHSHPISESKLEVDAIKKALSVLSPDTQQNLLSVLLATQSSQSNHQPQRNDSIKPSNQPTATTLLQDHLFQPDRPFNLPAPSDHESQSSPADEWNLPHRSSRLLQHDHSQPTSPVLSDMQTSSFHLPRDSNVITPRVSPSLTPLSTYSTSSHQSNYLSDATSICSQASFPSSSAPVELFSPLTSPALRPEGYPCTTSNRSSSNPTNVHLNMPTLINQAAALGLSSHQSFPSADQILSMTSRADRHDGFVMGAPPRPSNQQPTSYSQQIHNQGTIPSNHHVHQALSDSTYTSPYLTADTTAIGNITSSPVIHATTSSTRSVSGKQRAPRTLKSRPTPHPQNKPKSMSTDEGPNRSKRAKSVTSGSVASSPVINPKHSMSLTNTPLCFGSNFNGFPMGSNNLLGDSPSPVDLMATNEIESTSIPPTNATKPGTALPPATMSGMLSLSNNTNKRLRPLTPAGIMNLGHNTTTSTNQKRGSNESSKMDLDPTRSSVQTTERMDTDLGSLSQHTMISSPIQTRFDQYPTQATTNGNGPIDYTKSFNMLDVPSAVHPVENSNLPSGSNDPRSQAGLPNGTTTTTKLNKDVDEHKKKNQTGGLKRASSSSTTNLSLLPPENRRSSHKIAEQRRRDSLKMCFEDLRQILPPIHWSEDEDQVRRPGEGNVGGQRNQTSFDPNHPNKGISKVALLRRSNEYILTLHQRLNRRDEMIKMMMERIRKIGEGESGGASGGTTTTFGLIEEGLRLIELEKIEDEERRRKVMEMNCGEEMMAHHQAHDQDDEQQQEEEGKEKKDLDGLMINKKEQVNGNQKNGNRQKKNELGKPMKKKPNSKTLNDEIVL